MTPDRPSDPQKGKPAEEEQIELEAAEAKAEVKKPRRIRKAAKAEQGPQPVAESAPAKKRRSAKKASAGKAPAAPAAEESTPAGEVAEAEPAVAEKAPPAKARATAKPAAEPSAAPRRRGAGQQAAPRRKVVRAHARYVRTKKNIQVENYFETCGFSVVERTPEMVSYWLTLTDYRPFERIYIASHA